MAMKVSAVMQLETTWSSCMSQPCSLACLASSSLSFVNLRARWDWGVSREAGDGGKLMGSRLRSVYASCTVALII